VAAVLLPRPERAMRCRPARADEAGRGAGGAVVALVLAKAWAGVALAQAKARAGVALAQAKARAGVALAQAKDMPRPRSSTSTQNPRPTVCAGRAATFHRLVSMMMCNTVVREDLGWCALG
jgi:hypothetical protein